MVNGWYRLIIMTKGWDDFGLANHAWLNLPIIPHAKTHPLHSKSKHCPAVPNVYAVHYH